MSTLFFCARSTDVRKLTVRDLLIRHRILVYRLEQQLHSRQISYRSSSNVSTRLSIDVEPPPYLILKAQELVRLPLSRGSVRDGGLGEGSIVLDKAALRCQIDDETKAIRVSDLSPSRPWYRRSSSRETHCRGARRLYTCDSIPLSQSTRYRLPSRRSRSHPKMATKHSQQARRYLETCSIIRLRELSFS